MKKLLPAFIDKIKKVLKQYHAQIIDMALNYADISKNKFGNSIIKKKCLIDHVTRELLLQSVQMIIDISLNEMSIHYLESSQAKFGTFYLKVEKIILNE